MEFEKNSVLCIKKFIEFCLVWLVYKKVGAKVPAFLFKPL